MNNTTSTPLLNAQDGKVGGGFQQMDTDFSGVESAHAQNKRQFANKYQKNAMVLQETFDLSQAAHPGACIATILFKGLAVARYTQR